MSLVPIPRQSDAMNIPLSLSLPPAYPADMAVLGEKDFYLFNEGSHYGIYEKLGAHPCLRDGRPGTQFASGRRRIPSTQRSAAERFGSATSQALPWRTECRPDVEATFRWSVVAWPASTTSSLWKSAIDS
jgi:hypothetical protein